MKNDLESNILNIDLTDYWLIIQKRLFFILSIFILVVVGTYIYTLRQTPVYQAECKIKISSRQPMATIEGAQITWYGSHGNELNSEVNLISSKDNLMSQVIDFLKKKEKSEPLSSSDQPYYLDEDVSYIKSLRFSPAEEDFVKTLRISDLRSMIELIPVPQTNIVAIKANCPFPEVAIAVANLVAMVYRSDFWRGKTFDARETKKFIEDQLQKVVKDLETTKDDLEKSSEENTTIGSAEVYQKELATLKVDLEKLREKYKDTHPRVIKQKQIIETVEAELTKIPKTKLRYDDTMAEMELKKNLRKSLGEYYLKAEIDYEAKHLKARDEIMIVSLAQGSSKLKPNMSMNLFAGILFGVILGCLLAFIWEGLDTSIGKIEDVERITQLPVIAHIPQLGEQSKYNIRPLMLLQRIAVNLFFAIVPIRRKAKPVDLDKKILFNFDPLSVASEAYRTLRTNIQFAIGARKTTGNVIAIASTSPREGKTLTATNLSIALAQMGKMTLLIEGDMRCPRIALLFKINEKPGLSDILIGTATPDSAIRTFTDILIGGSEWDKLIDTHGIDNLHLLPCGTIPPNPSELLLSPEFKDLIDSLRKNYDFIIIDTPPTLPVSDSSIISTVVDGTVIVYQSDTTSRHLLLRAIQTLKKNQAKLLGIVINQLSFDVVMRSARLGYGYQLYKPSE